MLPLLDLLLAVFHIALTIFNLTGWIWKRTRKAHLITLLITAASWTVLGIWYGWGYCPLTDWHWDVKTALGERDLPASFVKYYGDKLFRTDFDPGLIESITLWCLVGAATASVTVNIVLPLVRRRPRRELHSK